MQKNFKLLAYSIAAPFRHFALFIAMATLPLAFSLIYFKMGTSWSSGIIPDHWQHYKSIEKDSVRYLCQATFLCLWYPLMVRQEVGQKVKCISTAIPLFFLAYGLIFVLTKAIYWLATLGHIGLFFVIRGFNQGLPDDVNFLMAVAVIMSVVGALIATIINRCSFGLPDCATGTYSSIADGWHRSTIYSNQLLICTAILFGINMLVGQLINFGVIESAWQSDAGLWDWISETFDHIRRYLLLAMTAAMITKLSQSPNSPLEETPPAPYYSDR